MDHYAEADRLLASEFDLPAKRSTARALTELEPALEPGAGRGLALRSATRTCGRTGSCACWRRHSMRQDLAFREHCEFRGVNARTAGPVRRRHARAIPADAVVVATGRLDAAADEALGCPRADPAGQGLLDHDAAAAAVPEDPDDLRGAPRRRHAVPLRLPHRLDDGVRRLRRDAEPRPARPAPATEPRALPARARGRAGAGRMVGLAADGARRHADHRTHCRDRQRLDRGRARHARPVDGHGHRASWSPN